MSDPIDDAIEALTNAIRQQCMESVAEDSREAMLENPKEIVDYLFDGDPLFGGVLYYHVAGIGYKDGGKFPPLTYYIRDISGDYIRDFDPIEDVIATIKNDRLDKEDANEMIERSIAALQSGIDRLKASLK